MSRLAEHAMSEVNGRNTASRSQMCMCHLDSSRLSTQVKEQASIATDELSYTTSWRRFVAARHAP